MEATTAQPQCAADQYVISHRPNLNPVARFNPNTKFHCNICMKNVSDVAFIKSAETPDFDICLECFCEGKERGDHQAHHPYMVVGDPKLSVFEETWGVGEEALLLESIEMFGLGNWEDIANHVATKSEEECMHHYFDVYVTDRPDLTPDLNSIRSREEGLEMAAKRRNAETEAWSSLPQVSIALKSSGSHSTIDSAGYMPLRGDFDIEYNNGAERHMKDIAFTGDDNALERELKFAIIDIYNTVLDDRGVRRRVIEDEGLVDLRKIQGATRKRPALEIEVRDVLKNLVRFQDGKEHQNFIDALDNQFQLKARILLLQEYRRHGITTLEGAQQYEIAKKNREADKDKKANTSNESKRGNDSVHHRRNSHLFLDQSNLIRHHTNVGVDDNETGALIQLSKYKHLQPIDLTGVPGVDLLSHNERRLCSQLRLFPEEFTAVKRSLITEAHHRNGISRTDAVALCNNTIEDAGKLGIVYDFLIESGWVKVD